MPELGDLVGKEVLHHIPNGHDGTQYLLFKDGLVLEVHLPEQPFVKPRDLNYYKEQVTQTTDPGSQLLAEDAAEILKFYK